MPFWHSKGCFSLSCIGKEYPVKNDLPDVTVESDIFDVIVESDIVDLTVKNDLLDLTFEKLRQYTGQFSPDNLVAISQYGKLYRGKMPVGLNQEDETTKDVAIKILFDPRLLRDNKDLVRFEDELKFLQDPRIRGNPNLVKLIGYCREDKILGVVYDLKPRDTLYNLIIQDEFKWLDRVRAALALARLLNFLHCQKSQYLIRNINPAHIVLDKDFNPILFEFGMLLGSALDKTVSQREAGTFGYIDPIVAQCGAWTVKSDVYSFGVLLLDLMSKRVIDLKNTLATAVDLWALKEYKPGCSLVHQSLEDDPYFDRRDGPKMTDLAMQCMDEEEKKRPLMKEVVSRLEALHVVQQHAQRK
ncbi:putative serine/threonine-protein kinase PBL21 [Nicotiana tabacum]|uniref:Serine/threonine-protein kinase PBL21 n=1 Tax=Nicotiana tabacum TaxID=4097 RepID=A0A1S3XK64_TOBAC